MEAAGVALGAIPLVLIALEKYAKVARILKDYSRYDATISRLQISLWIQEEQYDDTIELIGLRDLSLQEIETQLRYRHPQKCDKFMIIIKRINFIAERIASVLDAGSLNQVRWRQDSEARFKLEMQKILLSLDLEDGELRLLFDEMEKLNKALKSCFEKIEVPSAEAVDNRVVKRLHACFNADQCIAANYNAQALHGALQAGWQCTCAFPHKGGLRLMWHTKKWLSPVDFEMILSSTSVSAGTQQELWKEVKMNVTEGIPSTPLAPQTCLQPAVSSKKSLQERWSTRLKGVRVQDNTVAGAQVTATSTKPAAAVKLPTHSNTSPSLPASSPIEDLCLNLRDCTGIARDLGFLLHPDPAIKKYIQVYSTPAKPSNLVNSQILVGNVRKARLTRRRRFETAASVCWGVLLLADTNWLSDDLTEDEVQLMTSVGKAHARDGLEDTYVSYSFHPHTLTHNPPPSTNDPQSFIRNRTLFALGILLMELCLNRALPLLRSELQGRSSPADSASASTEDLDECLEEVYDEAGDEYGYAVQRCLRCEFPGPDRQKNFQHPAFRTHFFRGVVAPVQATYEMISNPTVTVGS